MNHTRIIIKDEFLQILHSKKIVYIAMFGLLLFLAVYTTRIIQLGILILLDPENELNLYSLVTYYTLYILIPILAILFGHDLISAERRNLRFLASRYPRSSIILGKYLANMIIMMIFILLTICASMSYSFIKTQNAGVIDNLLGFIYLTAFLSAWMGLNTLLSVCSRSSLYASFIALFAILIVSKTSIAIVSPFHYFSRLGSISSINVTILVIFALLLVLMSVLIIRRQDL